jgi:hypothetical protein
MLLCAYNAQLCGEAIPYELLVERSGYAAKQSSIRSKLLWLVVKIFFFKR